MGLRKDCLETCHLFRLWLWHCRSVPLTYLSTYIDYESMKSANRPLPDTQWEPPDCHSSAAVQDFVFYGGVFFIRAIQIEIGLCPSLGCWPDSSCESVFCSSLTVMDFFGNTNCQWYLSEMTQSCILVLAESLHSIESLTECHTPKYVSWPASGFFPPSNLHRQALLHKKNTTKTICNNHFCHGRYDLQAMTQSVLKVFRDEQLI